MGDVHDAAQRHDSKDSSQLEFRFHEISQVLLSCERATGLPLALNQVMRILGEAVGACHVGVCENVPAQGNGALGFKPLARWSRNGLPASTSQHPELALCTYYEPHWRSRLLAGETLHGPAQEVITSGHPALAGHELEAVAIIPLRAGQALWGIIELACCDSARAWTPVELTLARQAGALIQMRVAGLSETPAVDDGHQRFLAMFEQAPLAYMALDAGGQIVEVNQAWLRQLGFAKDEVLGRWFGDLLPVNQREAFRAHYEQCQHDHQAHSAQWRVLREDSSYMDASVMCQAQPDQTIAFTGTLCVLIDITELMIAQETLAQSEMLKSVVLGNIDEVVVYQDLKQNVVWANHATEIYANKDIANILGRKCYETLYHRDEPCPGCPIKDVTQSGLPQRAEIESPDGHWWEVFGTPVFSRENGDRKIIGLIKVARDISGRKQALKRLKDDEARYRAVVEDQTEFICRFTPDGKLTFANAAICRLYNMDPVSAIGKQIGEFLTQDELRRFMIRVERITPRHPIQTFRVHSITPEGRNYWGDWTIRAIFDEDSFLVDYQAVGRDVTAEQKARHQLAENRASLAEAQAIAHVGSWRWDIEQNEVHWSEETYRIFGIDPRPGPHPRGYFRDYVHPDDYDKMAKAIDTAIAGGPPYNIHYRILRKDGTLRHIHSQGVVRRDADGKPIRFTGILHDVTELQAAQEALARSEARLKAMMQAVPDLMFRIDRDGRYLEFFAEEDLLAAPPPNLIGHTMDEVLPEAVARVANAALARALNTGDVSTFEYDLDVPAGRFSFEARMCRCAVDEVLAIVRDITPRVQAQRALRQSEQHFRNIVELATEGVLMIDEQLHIKYVNDRMAQMLGRTADELIGQTVEHLMFPEDIPDHTKQIERRLRGESGAYERQLLHKDGHAVPAHVSARALLHADGSFAGSFAIFTDITSSKKTEQALRDSESRYRHLFDNLLDAVYIHGQSAADPRGRILEANSAASKMLGYTLEEFQQMSPADFDAWHPPHIAELQERLNRGEHAVFEQRHLAKDGGIIPVEIHASTLELQGEPVVLSVVRDIRARQEAEAELKRSEERFRNMFEHHDLPMLLIEPNTGQIINANAAAQNFYGYSLEEFQLMDIADINMLPSSTVKEERLRAKNAECVRFIFPHRLANGEIRTVEVYSSGIEVEGQTLLFSIIHDITEREQALEQLRDSEARFRGLLHIAPVAIGLVINRNIQWTNELMQNMLGYTNEELAGQSARMLYSSQKEYDQVGTEMQGQIMEHGRCILEVSWLRHDGNTVEVLLSTAPIDPTDHGQGLIFTALDITERKLAEEERNKLITDLSRSLAEIRTLSGLLPICANCKKIRTDSGYWQQIEGYIEQHSAAQFSHSICPECVKKLYPDYQDESSAEEE